MRLFYTLPFFFVACQSEIALGEVAEFEELSNVFANRILCAGIWEKIRYLPLLLAVFLMMPAGVTGQTVLNAGDVAIVGIASNVGDDDLGAYCETGAGTGRDRISIVCFKDITTGTSIDFTDNGWERAAAGQWGNSEGFLTITRTGGTIPAGTTITIEFPRTPSGLPPAFLLPDADWSYAQIGTRFCNLGSNGDQLYVMQDGVWNNGTGCPAACNNDATYTGGRILYAFSTNGWVSTPPGSANNVFQSRLHPSVNPCYNISIPTNFCSYQNPITSTTKPNWMSRIKSTANWVTYSDCTTYEAPPDFFPVGPEDVFLDCVANCSGCAPLSSTLKLSIGLPSGWGPFTVVYSNGSTNTTINNATSGQTITVVSNASTTYSIVSITAANACPMTYTFGSADVTVSPKPSFQNFSQSVCSGSALDLATLNYQGTNIAGATLTFHSANPPTPANQLSGTNVTVSNSITYYGLATSPNGCLDTFPILLTAVPPPNAGVVQDTSFCFHFNGAANLALGNLLTGENAGGIWTLAAGSANPGGNFSAASGVLNPNNLPAGDYAFSYTVNGSGACPQAVSTVHVTVTTGFTAGNPVPLNICGNGTAVFDLTQQDNSILNGNAGMVSWYSNAAATTVIANPSTYSSSGGTVYAVATSALGCSSGIVPLALTVSPLPNAGTATNPPAQCFVATGGAVLNLFNQLTGENPGGAWTLAAGSANPGANFNAAAGTLDFNNLPAGNYAFTYTINTAQCGSDNETVTLLVHPAPQASINTTPVPCNGGNTGSLSVSTSAGLAPFQFNIGSGNQANSTFNNLAAGAYSVTISDANGCTLTQSATIAQPPALSVTNLATNASCGLNNGAINVTATGGTPPYAFDWADLPGINDPEDRSGLSAGTYSVTVTDQHGCTASTSATVVQIPALNFLLAVTNASCGLNNGVINGTTSGGTPAYKFDWADLPGTNDPEDRSGLSAGTYSVTVTDNNGCTFTNMADLTNNGALLLNCSQLSPVSAFGASDGVGQITPSGNAVFPMTVQWSGPVSGTQNFSAGPINVSNLPAGVYSTTVTNANACTATCGFTILNPNCGKPDSTLLSSTTCNPTQAGVQIQMLVNQAGCDSVVITTTTLLPSDTTNITTTSCDPAQAGSSQQLFTSANGCDSLVITTTTLALPDSTFLSAATCDPAMVGQQVQLLVNQAGCDSVIVTTLTLLPADTTNITATSCDPAQVGTSQQLFTSANGCDSLVITTTTLALPDSTFLSATTCNPAMVGQQVQLLVNQAGCDSVIVTTVTLLPADTTIITANTCDPAQVGTSQQLLSGINGCDSLVITTTTLVLPDSTFLSAVTCDPAMVGLQIQLLVNQAGCDSVIVTTVTLLPADTTNITASTCDPAQVGTSQQLFASANGCDSLVITTTTLALSDSTFLSATTCDPAMVGQQVQLLVNQAGCDSVIVTTLTLLPADTTNITASTCNPAQVGTSQQLLSGVNGCDSLVITTTTLVLPDSTFLSATTCDPAMVGQQVQLLVNQSGCDSVIVTTLTLLLSDTTNITAITCDPAQVGTSQQLLSGINGCDSLVITTTTLVLPDSTYLSATTCDPAMVGQQVQLLVNQAGCDSVIVTTLTLLPADTTNITASTCDPAQVGTSQQLLSGINGCDSLVITTTTLSQSAQSTFTATLCGDEFIIVNGTRYDIDHPFGTETLPGASAGGCDSLITIQLNFNALDVSVFGFAPKCFGDPNGSIFIESLSGGIPPYRYSENNIDFMPIADPFEINGLDAGNYPLFIRDSAGCRFDTTIQLAAPAELLLDLQGPANIGIGDSLQLVPQLNFQPDSISWKHTEYLSCDTCIDPVAKPFQTANYTLTAFDQNGCSASSSILVVVSKTVGLYVPNVFNPGADGGNSVLSIWADASVRKIKSFRVFDRWGETVYEQRDFFPNDPSTAWDGRFKGSALTPGVYVYELEGEYVDGTTVILSGDVSLLR